MKERSYVLVGKWQNALALAGSVTKRARKASDKKNETLLERRERENSVMQSEGYGMQKGRWHARQAFAVWVSDYAWWVTAGSVRSWSRSWSMT